MYATPCRVALFAALLWTSPLLAQDLPDASLPDASVGQGGADQNSEENDPGTPCLDARDCIGRFTCQAGRCVPRGIQRASCGGTAAFGTLVLGAGLVLARRPRR
jgi:hypothetical protein